MCVCGRVDRSCSRDREVFWRRKRLVSIQICIRLAQKQHVLRMKGQRVGRNMSAGEAFWFLIVTFKGGRGWSTGKKKTLTCIIQTNFTTALSCHSDKEK